MFVIKIKIDVVVAIVNNDDNNECWLLSPFNRVNIIVIKIHLFTIAMDFIMPLSIFRMNFEASRCFNPKSRFHPLFDYTHISHSK